MSIARTLSRRLHFGWQQAEHRVGSECDDFRSEEAQTALETAMAAELDGEGRRYITLAAFLKMEDLADTGGQAKQRVRSGGIRVNGVEEIRPGRKLHDGDKVEVDRKVFRVVVED